MQITPTNGLLSPTPQVKEDERIRQVAQDLEASFLSEMLKHSGYGKTSETFGGGIGEDQFGSFLRDQHAQLLAEKGGIGLAEQLFEALKENARV